MARRTRGLTRGHAAAAFASAALFLLFLLPAPAVWGKGSLPAVEKEFRHAMALGASAAVICLAAGVPEEQVGLGSSGVIVSKSGYVLSDGDAGSYRSGRGPQAKLKHAESVEVRLPDLEAGGFTSHMATVVRRVRSLDTCLLRIHDVPSGGFDDYLQPSRSEHLQVGDYTFVTGNAFGASHEAPPATTAGVVSSMTYLPANDAGGRLAALYTSAAVNPGVNGGPVVDVEGRLVGTVSTYLPPAPGEPYQFLGKVVPIDRIRAVFSDLPEAEEIFGQDPKKGRSAKEARALETVFRHAARRTYPHVLSLEVKRTGPMSTVSPGVGGLFPIPRYTGSVSGVLIDPDGWIVTSLYNLTNIAELVFTGAAFPQWRPPAEHQVETGLRAIEDVTAHFPDGRKASARVVAHDGRLGIALLKADLSGKNGGSTLTAEGIARLEPAPAETFVEGRFVVAVGNPFGKDRNPDPLVTIGVLSKLHGEGVLAPWRGQWQTDAGTTDANCGGALVDLRGRLVGVLHLWSPPMFGRTSGIAFVVPWTRIEEALPGLMEGKSSKRPFLGVLWKHSNATKPAVVERVVPDSAAAQAGMQPGDRIARVAGAATPTTADVVKRLAVRWAGDRLKLVVMRGGEEVELDVTLGERPAEK